ncbi:MAG: hypothetical protein O2820_19735, partial [Planctomycetota bacterium]|nr:hypothetical protein [Planctomycetota bacterium]
MTWAGFMERYESELLVNVAPVTADTDRSSLRLFAESCNVKRIRDVNEQRLARFRKVLDERTGSVETVARHLRSLRVAINFAADVRLLPQRLKVRIPKLNKGSRAKGRAITREEFDRMLDAAEKFLQPEKLAEWQVLPAWAVVVCD